MFNQVTILGRITRDIDLRYTKSGTAVAKTAIASSYKFKDKTTGEQKEETMFIDVNFFGRGAEIANQYVKKGDLVFLIGRLTLNQWVGSDGSKRQKHEVIVEELKLLPKSVNGGEQSQIQTKNQTSRIQSQSEVPQVDIDEDDIPF